MDEYFTTQEGALRRLVGLRRGATGTSGSPIVIGKRTDGSEVNGLAEVLSSVRAGRISSFIHSSPTDTHVVFVS
jgi:hypothetical protein